MFSVRINVDHSHEYVSTCKDRVDYLFIHENGRCISGQVKIYLVYVYNIPRKKETYVRTNFDLCYVLAAPQRMSSSRRLCADRFSCDRFLGRALKNGRTFYTRKALTRPVLSENTLNAVVWYW